MRIDELHKFSDGTLNDARNALDDRLKGIRMQYLPTTIWRRGDKDRAAAMIQVIDKMLKTRRIMRSMEKFVGGRLYDKKEKSEKLGIVPTEIELILEHTQQGIGYEVSISTEGVEELKRNDKIKGVKKEALLIHLGRNWVNTYAIRNTKMLSGIRRALLMLEILSRRFFLKLNLSDHREHKREVEIPDFS
nr:hypothetical protein [Tanacetum cinerariifolium]